MRQTNLSFEEMECLLKNPEESEYPICLLVNEIGVLAKDGNTKARQALITHLENENPSCRFAAAGWIGEIGIVEAAELLRIAKDKELDETIFNAELQALEKLEVILKKLEETDKIK